MQTLELLLKSGTLFWGNGGVEKWVSAKDYFFASQNTVAAKPQLQPDGLYFDGGDYLNIADNAAYRPGTLNFSISFWCNLSLSSRGDQIGGSSVYIYSLGAAGTSAGAAIGTTTVTWTQNYSSGGNWHFIEIGRVGTTVFAREDGVQKNTAVQSPVQDISNIGFFLGCHSSVSSFSIGKFADLRIAIGYAPQYVTPPPRSQFNDTLYQAPPLAAISAALSNKQFQFGG